MLDIDGQAAPHDTQVWLPLGGKLVPRALGRRLPPALRPRLGAVVLHKPDVQCAQVGLALLTCTGQPIRPTERGPCLQQPGRRALRPAPRAAEATADRVRDAGQDGPSQEVQAGFPLRRGPPAMGPWRGEPTAHASPSLGWVTSAERLCTARAPGAACFGSAQSKGYARATAPGVPSTCAAERRGVRPAAGLRKSHFERGASHFGRKRTARGRTRKIQGKPRRAPACGPARHWRFAGGAFTLPLTR